MGGYAKVFTSILTSSLWNEAPTVRIVFLTLILLRDRDHIVLSTPEALARVANLPLREVQRAIKILCQPDQNSRSEAEGGRRLKPVRGGWHVVNGEFYRNLMSEADKRERTRERVQRFRERVRNAPVTLGNACNDIQRSDPEAEIRGGEDPPKPPAPPRFPLHCPEHADVEFPPRCGACKERREARERDQGGDSGSLSSEILRKTPALKVCPECGRRCMSDGECPACRVMKEDR